MQRFAGEPRPRSTPSLRLLLLLGLAVGMAGVPGTAFGRGGVSSSDWAASVCEAIDDWTSEVDDREFDAYPIEEDDPRLERKHLRALFEAELEETETLVERLEDAGEPDTQRGHAIARDLRQGFRDVRSALRRLLRDADRIVGPDRQAFLEKRAAVAHNVADAGVGLYDDLGHVASAFPPRLARAISDEACDPFAESALYFGDIVSEVSEGDCFSDVPGGPELPSGQQFVAVVPCVTGHASEVFANAEFPEPPGAEYPGDEALGMRANEECRERFDNYVGSEYESSSLEIRYLYPTADDWDVDDRFFTCILTAPDGISTSAKASGL